MIEILVEEIEEETEDLEESTEVEEVEAEIELKEAEEGKCMVSMVFLRRVFTIHESSDKTLMITCKPIEGVEEPEVAEAEDIKAVMIMTVQGEI
jgi:hypothetical protein